MPDVSLDDLYGPSRPPAGEVKLLESRVRPAYLRRLDGESGAQLWSVLQAVAQGLETARVVFDLYPLLWVIDANGDAWFAMEECWDVQTGRLAGLSQRDPGLRDPRWEKTGHPAMLMDDPSARIGGEIAFHGRHRAWMITNASGRYGYRPGTALRHLEAAAALFALHGPRLRPKFAAML